MSILRNRQFAILFSGQVVSKFGTNLFLLALPWYVYIVTGSKTDLAIVGFAQSIPSVAGLFAGVFVDRWNKRLTMVVTDVLRAGLSVAVGFVAFFHAGFWWVVGLVLLMELFGVVFSPAASVLIPMVVGKEEIPAAMGLTQSGEATAQLAGQVSGGALLSALGAPLLFFANGASFLVSVVSLLFIRTSEPSRRHQAMNFFSEWKEGLRIATRSRMVLRILFSALLTNFGLAAFDITLTAWVKGPLHSSALWLGIIGATFFVGVILGGVLLGPITKKVPLQRTLMLGLILAGATISSVGIFENRFWSMGVLVVCGISIGVLNGALGAFAISVVPQAVRGRVFGLLGSLGTIATPLGMAIFGALMVKVSLPVEFVAMGSVSILSGLTYVLPVRDDSEAMSAAG